MKTNGSVVLGIIALIMVSIACLVLIFYRYGGGRESNSKTIRYAGRLGKLLFAASVILIAIGLIAVPSKGEGYISGVSGMIGDDNPLVEGISEPVEPAMPGDDGAMPDLGAGCVGRCGQY